MLSYKKLLRGQLVVTVVYYIPRIFDLELVFVEIPLKLNGSMG